MERKKKKMKAKIRHFLKIRKQNDYVKLLCLLALVGLVSFGRTVYYAGGMYSYVNTPVEYILTGDQVVSKSCMDELLHSDGVTRVSCQMEIPITIKYRGVQAMISCTVLSREYLETMTSRKLQDGTRRIYMNSTAFSQLQQQISEQNGSLEGIGERESMASDTEWNIRYAMEEASPETDSGDAVSMQNDRSAKLVVMELSLLGNTGEEGFVCMAETDNRLLKEASSLRVQFDRHDLDGLHVDRLRKMGYGIENEEEIITEEYEIRLKLLHIWYGMFLGGICLVVVFALRKLVGGREF